MTTTPLIINITKMNKLYFPKNISRLTQLYKQNKKIHIIGLNSIIENIDSTTQKSIFIDISKIKEFNLTIKSTHSSVIGLNNTIARLISLTPQGIVCPLLERCLFENYYSDTWNISLFQAIFGNSTPSLFMLFLTMLNAYVLIIKDKIMWVSFRDLMTKNSTPQIMNYIPIQIRMNIFSNTQHSFLAPSLSRKTTSVPNFSHPIILGQLAINPYKNTINDVQLLYFTEQQQIILFDLYFKKIIGQTLPVPIQQIIQIWDKIPTQHLEKKQQQYLLESTISLLYPSFTRGKFYVHSSK